MSYSEICFSEQLTFLKYINAHYLFYTLTLGTFASLFALVWILKTYTYFEKRKISRGSLPAFPYGNFRDILKRNTSLHTFLWKQHNKFKKRKCPFGGIFLLVRPVLVVVDRSLACKGALLLPNQSKLTLPDASALLSSEISNWFIQSFNFSLKEKLLTSDTATTLKDYLLESTCLLFGFQPTEIVEELNEMLRQNFTTSLQFYLRLGWTLQVPPRRHPQHLLLDIMESRKKNDSEANDLIEAFTRLLNDCDLYSVQDIAEEVFNVFLDTLSYSCSSLIFCFYELAINGEVQQELLDEIRRFRKRNQPLTSESLGQMEFLNAVIKETFRKYPPVSTIIRSGKGVDWNPIKDGLTFQSVLAIHRDPQCYTKPEAFEPDRFLDNIPVNEETYMPFGVGAGSQLRMNLISLQVGLVLVSVFSHLQVALKEGSSGFKYNPTLLYLSPCEGPQLEFSRI